MGRKGEKFKAQLYRDVYFKDYSTLMNFINLYQDLFIKNSYNMLILNYEPVYKYRIVFEIWNDDWKDIKEKLQLKYTKITFDFKGQDIRKIHAFVFE